MIFLQETSFNHLLHPTPSSIPQELQGSSLKNSNYNNNDGKETDVDSTPGPEQSSLLLQNHQQLQKNPPNWYVYLK